MSEHDNKNKDWSQDQGLSYKDELKKRVNHAGKKAGTDGAIKIGYIPDNNEHDDVKISIAEEKKKDEEFERIVAKQILDEFLADICERIAQLEKQLKATNKVQKLHENGELDFDDPMHILLIQQAGMDLEDVKNNPEAAIEENKIRINEKIEDLRDEVKERYDGKYEVELFEPVASQIDPENQIKAESPRSEFMRVASPQPNNSVALDTKVDAEQVQTLDKPLSTIGAITID